MDSYLSVAQLLELGLASSDAESLYAQVQTVMQSAQTAVNAWQIISKNILSADNHLNDRYPFSVHLLLFSFLFPKWLEQQETAPAWIPEDKWKLTTNIFRMMSELKIDDIKTFHHWTITQYQDFWQWMINKLAIVFKLPPQQICDLSQGVENPTWFTHAKMNIADSCFKAAPEKIALIYLDKNKNLKTMSYSDLDMLSNRIATSLVKLGLKQGDAIAISMPMTQYAVAIYLGIIKMGGLVVSIPDSFSPQEISNRLEIANSKIIFTQDFSLWDGKELPLYQKICLTNATTIIVLHDEQCTNTIHLRNSDLSFEQFLSEDHDFISTPMNPMDSCHILFSSGTTGDAKAIIWNHTTAIKAAVDAYLHLNIKPNHRLAWPTNLGWMMGPWLIFASLINQASIALYTDAPKNRAFGEFIQDAKVTMLGVVPTLVATWRHTQCMKNLDWQTIELFASTGECSNASDMLYLMSLAAYKPVIEYCGGTEIGGAYLSSTLIENNYPTLFSTPTMGLQITILDELGQEALAGEVAIIPPSIGLSTRLLNADHNQAYFADMPKSRDGKTLRRHGDKVKQLSNGYYCVLGRVDDSMNLGGIKTSAVEIERTLTGIPHVDEVAAIAVAKEHSGPNLLVIYAVTNKLLDPITLKKDMQKRINTLLNPLFKINDIVFIKELPKTASNKIMRRLLRKKYQEKQKMG